MNSTKALNLVPDKSAERARVEDAIKGLLDAGLPRTYSTALYRQKCSAGFEHFYESYPVAPTKRDLPINERDQSMVGDGHAMGVAAQILEHKLWATAGWFQMTIQSLR